MRGVRGGEKNTVVDGWKHSCRGMESFKIESPERAEKIAGRGVSAPERIASPLAQAALQGIRVSINFGMRLFASLKTLQIFGATHSGKLQFARSKGKKSRLRGVRRSLT